jgi:hypothetical protein
MRKRAGDSLSSLLERGFQMIALKIAALVLGATMALSFLSGDFGPDFVLAIVTCLS